MSRSAETAIGRQGSVPAGKPARATSSAKSDRTAIRVVINLGKSELEMLRTSNAATGALSPLARFTIGNLWVAFRSVLDSWLLNLCKYVMHSVSEFDFMVIQSSLRGAPMNDWVLLGSGKSSRILQPLHAACLQMHIAIWQEKRVLLQI